MRLKKLTLFGFKSFANKVSLDFDADIVGIVGPNGCGKSNIVDAFRWVMGELSAKSLRGEKMEDLLFAGSEKSTPCHVASVSVHLTDVSKTLPIEYDELIIERKVHRSGESEYFINKNPVRLKDIQNLLLGSGLGKGAFSIFEQGKLDQIIHKSAIERRVIFDECAGTICFLQQKKEALKKIQEVSRNSDRLKDLHGEIEKQLRALRRASKAAKSFQEKKEHLLWLERALVLVLLETSITQEGEHLQEYKELESRCCGTKSELKGLISEQEKLTEQVNQSQKRVDETKQTLYRVQSEVQVQLNELRGLKEKKEELEKGQLAIKRELNEQEEYLVAAQLRLNVHTTETEKLQGQAAELRVKVDAVKAVLDTHDKKLNEQSTLLSKKMLEMAALQTSLSEAQTKLHQLSLKEEGIVSQLEMMRRAKGDKTESQKELLAKVNQKEKKVATLSDSRSLLQKEEKKKDLKDNTLAEELDVLGKKLTKLLQQISEKQAHQKSLQTLQQEFEGFSKGAKHLLASTKKKTSPLYGRLKGLYEELKPKKGQEKAFSVSMRSYSDTLIVDTQEDVESVLAFANKEGIADFSLICKDHLSAKLTDQPFAEKGSLASHFLGHVQTQDSLHLALEHLSEGAFVTEEGDFIDTKHVIFKGGKAHAETNTFLRKSLIETLTEELSILEGKSEILVKKIKAKKAAKKRLEKELAEVREELKFKEMSYAQESFTLNRYQKDLASGEEELAHLMQDICDLDVSLKSYAKEKEGAKKRYERVCQEHKQHLQQINASEKSRNGLAEKRALCKQEYQRQLEVYETASIKCQEMKNTLSIEQVKHEEGAIRETRLREELKNIKERIGSCKEALLQQEKLLADKQGVLSHSLATLNEAEQEAAHIDIACKTSQTHLAKVQKTVESSSDLLHSKQVEITQIETKKRELLRELESRFNLTLEEGIELFPTVQDVEITESKKQIAQLRGELEKATAINLASIDECEVVEERFSTLDKQLQDIETTKKDLESLISKLDKESRLVFKKSFEKIRAAFIKNFQILFNGGEADLSFTGATDILEAGIEISARPPGKKMRNISLLSGGEKCLTALSLLFALFEVKPAPFCILDEVDAPLDDSNIDRFTNLLQQFISDTQFIIVTHNKKTMGIADILFGVSMEEKGVSKLISLAFERNSKKRAPITTEVSPCKSASQKR